MTFDDGIAYHLMIVVPGFAACGGRNDPELTNCWGLSVPALVGGDANGRDIQWVFPYAVFL